jgi:hypothetical protein
MRLIETVAMDVRRVMGFFTYAPPTCSTLKQLEQGARHVRVAENRQGVFFRRSISGVRSLRFTFDWRYADKAIVIVAHPTLLFGKRFGIRKEHVGPARYMPIRSHQLEGLTIRFIVL